MPDEEMEMAVDFGQPGFGEDIDIDLDFPAGEPDDDMDLGDYDGVHDIPNFNSDTRDELMAEDDDASYGMIDATETDHDALAATANDIDVELEHTVENIWQQGVSHSADLNPDTEIDYLDETLAENMDAERHDAETNEWPAAATNPRNADAIGDSNEASVEVLTGAQGLNEEPLPEDSATSHEEPLGPIEASDTKVEAAHTPVASDLVDNGQADVIDELPQDEVAEAVARTPDQPPIVDQDEQNAGQPNVDTGIEHRSPDDNLQESNEQVETSHIDESAQTGNDYNAESPVSSDPERVGPLEVTEPSDVKEDDNETPYPEEAGGPGDETSEYQLGGEAYNEHDNDQASDNVDDLQDEPSTPVHSGSQPPETNPTGDVESYQNEAAATTSIDTSAIAASGEDEPINLADHYGIYISYGETDYRLFAKSEDDDPNQYFLTDKSALDLPLARFLTSLREVISDEVSPLDELVMEVDGLGIEFSESTTPDFLEKYTFGDLVVLYDKLAKNEEAESSPPIYTYLSVKPNCSQRMMALADSANVGRGLSEVALYRDVSPVDEEGPDIESPDTDLSNDHGNDEHDSIYPQEDFEEGDAVDDGGPQDSPPAAAEPQLEDTSDQHKETDEPDDDEEQNFAGISTNSTDELELSVSRQGIYPFVFQYLFHCTRDSTCSCEDCYEAELQHLATPVRAEVRLSPGTVVPIRNSPMPMLPMTNHTITQDHAPSESSGSQPREADEYEPQPSLRASEASESKLQAPKVIPADQLTEFPSSENTSATVTLDGEEHDEIDYNSDDEENEKHEKHDEGIDGSSTQKQQSGTTPDLNAPVDDEITWESDDEEATDETKAGLSRDTVQVSPVSLKRTRSELDALDGGGGKNDNKRRRS